MAHGSAVRVASRDAASNAADGPMAQQPDHSVTEEVGRLPFRDPRHAQDYIEGLKAAGLS